MPTLKPRPRRLTPTQLLSRLMTCFYELEGKVFFSYKEYVALREVIGKEIEDELKEYLP